MLDIFKTVGKGTSYEFNKHVLFTHLPSKNTNDDNIEQSIIDNEWYDRRGNRYKLVDDVLLITANEFFPDEGYSVVDYINEIPLNMDLTIMLKVKSKTNEVAGFNMLCDLLSMHPVKQKIIIDITEMEFCEKVSLNIDNLPKNVKITSMIDHNLNENFIFSNQSFESWSLNCNDKHFRLLLSKLTTKSYERINRMREICAGFYRYALSVSKNTNHTQKALFAYNWCCDNIKYDVSAINDDGTLKYDGKDSQDPIVTFNKREGVCEGRARLLKLLLNNFYMQVPCFLVKGMSGRLQHTWNEILLENGTIIDLDISKQRNRVANNHNELMAFENLPKQIKTISKK